MSIKFTLAEDNYYVGDIVRVNYKIKEKDKERLQAFDGTIISIHGKKDNQILTVRKNASDGVSVERIFPLNSPWITSIKKIRSPKKKIRRAKLTYLRQSQIN